MSACRPSSRSGTLLALRVMASKSTAASCRKRRRSHVHIRISAAAACCAAPLRARRAGRSTRQSVAAAAPAPRLPARGNFVIRNAYVMTMERDTGDIANGDVHVKDGAIVAVGPKLNAPGARAINGAGMIVLPGLVETHWHMWNTLLRSMSGEKPEHGYFRTTAALGQKFEPGDMYQGTRLAAAEAINSGITFVHDWCHNIRGFDYAEADLRALKEPGCARASPMAARRRMPNSAGINLADLERLHRDWAELFQRRPDHARPRLARHGRQQSRRPRSRRRSTSARSRPPASSACRSRSTPAGSRPAAGQIDTIAKAGLLGKDMQIIHAIVATDDEIKAIADGRRLGQHLALSPSCASVSACRRRRNSSLPASRSGFRSTPSSSPAMPTCSAS